MFGTISNLPLRERDETLTDNDIGACILQVTWCKRQCRQMISKSRQNTGKDIECNQIVINVGLKQKAIQKNTCGYERNTYSVKIIQAEADIKTRNLVFPASHDNIIKYASNVSDFVYCPYCNNIAPMLTMPLELGFLCRKCLSPMYLPLMPRLP